jgi:hypothetical protein
MFDVHVWCSGCVCAYKHHQFPLRLSTLDQVEGLSRQPCQRKETVLLRNTNLRICLPSIEADCSLELVRVVE